MIPPIKWRQVRGANARNHMLFIEIEPDRPFGTLAQEVAEWQSKAIAFIPAGAAGFALLGAGAWFAVSLLWAAALAAILGMMGAAVIANNIVSGTREIEYWGRAVDVAAGGDLDRLVSQLSGYTQFRGAVPLATIRQEILDRVPQARRWLANNNEGLERAYAERLSA